MLDEAVVLDWTMDWPKSRARAEEADALVTAEPSLATPLLLPRLLMARGRTQMRQNLFAEAIATFREAIAAAEKVGEEGYEALTQSLQMIAFSGGNIGRYEEADEAAARVLRAYEEHGDMLGMAAALQNRAVSSYLTNKMDRVQADMERVIHIAREFGFSMSECLAVRDLAETLIYLGRPEEALPKSRRAQEMYTQQFGPGSRIVYAVDVQIARILAYAGDFAAAEEVARRVRTGQDEAKAAGRADAVLTDAERVVFDGLDCYLRGEPDEKFDELVVRGRELQLQGPDIVELMEWKGLNALRLGRREAAVELLQLALAQAENTISFDRVRRKLESIAPQVSRARAASSA